MKKIICSLLIILQIAVLINVNAAVGDVIGYACHTDIIATIGGAQIPSFNVNGDTYIIAEDLADYGFNVVWHPDDRLIAITRNTDVHYIYTSYVKPYVAPSEIGVPVYDILSTDINASLNGFYLGKYINGVPLYAYNINGRTIIPFDALGIFGNVNWNPDKREISLNLLSLSNIHTGVMTPEVALNELAAFTDKITDMANNIVTIETSNEDLINFTQYMYSSSDAVLSEMFGYFSHDSVLTNSYAALSYGSPEEMSADIQIARNDSQLQTASAMANARLDSLGSSTADIDIYLAGFEANFTSCSNLIPLFTYLAVN